MKEKKFLFFFLLLILCLPIFVFSFDLNLSQGPSKCCLLTNKITINGKTCDAGKIAAATLSDTGECGNGTFCNDSADYWASFCIINGIVSISKYLFYIALILSALFIVYSAILIGISFGDPQKFNQGKTSLIFALIGMGLALIGKWFPNIVGFFMGLDVKI